MKIGVYKLGYLDALLVFIPVSFILEFLHVNDTWVFFTSALAIIPLAAIMGTATEHLAAKFGPGIGGLLTSTFGNAAELIIAVFAIKNGLPEVVKASITGSIIGNILLVLGLSFVAGGVKVKTLKFNSTAAGLNSTMLILCTSALIVPAVISALLSGSHNLDKAKIHALDLKISLAIAIVLFVTYLLSLVFSLKSHKHLYGTADEEGAGHGEMVPWKTQTTLFVLLLATVGISFMSEIMVTSIEVATKTLGMNEVFVGVIVVAIVGNAAEHSTAI